MSMAVVALISLLGEPVKAVESICASTNMEVMEQTLPRFALFKKISKMIINACGEATLLISKANNIPIAEKSNICVCLWTNLLLHVHAAQSCECFDLVLDNISALIANVSIIYF